MQPQISTWIIIFLFCTNRQGWLMQISAYVEKRANLCIVGNRKSCENCLVIEWVQIDLNPFMIGSHCRRRCRDGHLVYLHSVCYTDSSGGWSGNVLQLFAASHWVCRAVTQQSRILHYCIAIYDNSAEVNSGLHSTDVIVQRDGGDREVWLVEVRQGGEGQDGERRRQEGLKPFRRDCQLPSTLIIGINLNNWHFLYHLN